ncbi:RagB/SusD family nutrient uptake outer membrane protein [Aquimarina sp. 2-A2]|uniref:RagB/SusD family nutrient uptake outer membrane protein n=1 Tax=Aquimarina sp. 2-A2 TaxID=3382644 RepID=UPI00387EF7A6
MKNNIKLISKYMMAGSVVLTSLLSCSIDEIADPNGPSVDVVSNAATKTQLDELAVGLESSIRNGLGVEVTASGIMARELYLFDADPRNTGDLLGKNGIQLDNNSFYSTAQWNGNYRAIKNANVLIEAISNTDAVDVTEKNGYLGFAKTMISYELIQILKSYHQARVDVSDPDNLGPLLEISAGFDYVIQLLNEANTDLNAAGTEFVFPLSTGFSGFDTPSTFLEFNRALVAVASVYNGNGQDALDALDDSFFNLSGALETGPKHVFGLGGNDQANPVFRAPSESAAEPNNGDQIIVHDSWINDAEAGDTRVANKTAVRPDPSIQDDLSGAYETRLYASSTSPVDLVRNEELILVYAEANILTTNFVEAANALSVIRNSAGLSDYTGALTQSALTDELLRQRRYSLWSENHRMFDMWRYGRSQTLPKDRSGDVIYSSFPIPLSENL